MLLAGHAYAGAVIAGPKDDRVKSLVYVAALAPAEGETVADVFYRAKPHPEAPHLEPDAHGFIWMPEGVLPTQSLTEASPDQTTILEAVQRPIAVKCIQEKAPVPAWKTKPSWFLLAEEDRMIAPETQRYMAERMGAKIRTHEVDHSPMYTAPDVVVGVILEAARETLASERELSGSTHADKSVAIVTGASQGIGRATAIRLARDFEAVVLAARQEDELKKTAAAVKSAGAEPLTYALDLREPRSAETLVQGTLDRFGRIDALVNIAGAVPQIDLFEMTDAQWEDGMALKLHGARRLTIRAWDALKASKRRGGADLRKRSSRSEAGLRGRSDHQRRHHRAREGLCRARH